MRHGLPFRSPISRKRETYRRHFIEKADAERDEYYASMAESMLQHFKTEQNTSESGIDDDCPFVGMAERKTENSSEKPNNLSEIPTGSERSE